MRQLFLLGLSALVLSIGLALFDVETRQTAAATEGDPGASQLKRQANASLPSKNAEPQLPPIDTLLEIVERPLFQEGRRARQESYRGPSATPSDALQLSLKGIFIDNGVSHAVFRSADQRRSLQLSQGMDHEGWKLASIEDRFVEFRRGSKSVRLTLDYSGSAYPTVEPLASSETESNAEQTAQ